MSNINKITITGLGMACVFVGTMIMIPSGTGGYINLGDGFILLFSSFLSPFSSFLIGGVTSALVDVFSGYGIYAPYTLLIKGLEAVLVSVLFQKWKEKFKLHIYILASLIMFFGYFLATWNITQSLLVAIGTLLGNAIQGLSGICIAYLLYNRFSLILSKANFNHTKRD